MQLSWAARSEECRMAIKVIPYPPVPEKVRPFSRLDRAFQKVLPAFLAPDCRVSDLFACRLADYEPAGAREDVTIRWFEKPEGFTPEQTAFMAGQAGRLEWAGWRLRMLLGWCWLGLGALGGRTVHFTFVQFSGSGCRPYRGIMPPRTAVVGLCWTAPEARGRRIYPYVVSQALGRLKAAGYAWAYIQTDVMNAPSLKGIRSDPGWKYVGRLLLRRRALGRFRIEAATIDNPEGTVFG